MVIDDDLTMAYVGNSQGYVHKINIQTRRILKTFDLNGQDSSYVFLSTALELIKMKTTGQKRLLVGIYESNITVLNAEDLSILQSIKGGTTTKSFTLLNDGNVLVTGDYRNLNFLSLSNRNGSISKLHGYENATPGNIISLSSISDSQFFTGDVKGYIKYWSFTSPNLLTEIKQLTPIITSLKGLAYDGQFLYGFHSGSPYRVYFWTSLSSFDTSYSILYEQGITAVETIKCRN